MDRQAKKSAKTQAEKEVNAMVEEHPFGPIENTLIVGYYRRGGFRLDRVRVCKSKAAAFEIPTAEFDPVYSCVEYQTESGGDTKTEILGFRTTLKCSLSSGQLWRVMGQQNLGYQISMVLAGSDHHEHVGQQQATVLVEILDKTDGSVIRSHKVSENMGRVFKLQKITDWLSRLPGGKHLRIRVTRDCVALWVDGELRQQLMRQQPLNHAERVTLESENDLLDTKCLVVRYCDGKAGYNKNYFKHLSEYLVYQLQRLKQLNELAPQSSVTDEVKHLKCMVNAIEFFFIRPFEDDKLSKDIPFGVLREAVEVTRQQLDEVSGGNKQMVSYLQTSIMMLFLSAKNLIDEFGYVLSRVIGPKLKALDPETLEHERSLYFILTPSFDTMFEMLIAHPSAVCDLEYRNSYQREEHSPELLLSKGEYHLYGGTREALLVRHHGMSCEVSETIKAPKNLSRLWDRGQNRHYSFYDDNLILFWRRVELQVAVLDVSAVIEVTLQKKKPSWKNCWIIPPKLPSTEEYNLSELAQKPLLFDSCLLLPTIVKSKLVLYCWSWKQQPSPQQWDVQAFDYPDPFPDEYLDTGVICTNHRHWIFVVLTLSSDHENETAYDVVSFCKAANDQSVELKFRQTLITLFPEMPVFSWLQKQGKVFLLLATTNLTRSRLYYLHNNKFVTISDKGCHAPGFQKFVNNSPHPVKLNTVPKDNGGDHLKRTVTLPSKTPGFGRLMVTCATIRF